MLFDATNGRPLAIMDSISITAIRTAAATAVAAKYLAREECGTMLVCGCGGQAAAQLDALLCVRKPRRIFAYDRAASRASAFSARFGAEVAHDLAGAARNERHRRDLHHRHEILHHARNDPSGRVHCGHRCRQRA